MGVDWEVASWYETGFDMNRGLTKEMFAFSFLSTVSTFCVLVTLFIFRKDLRRKPTTPIIFNIFISNFLTSIGSLPGVPIDQSFGCWFEGFVTNVFTLSSMFWTVVITWMMYCTIANTSLDYNHVLVSLLCWGVPVLATFLPFINSSYGAPDGEGWCWIIDTSYTPLWGAQFWFWMSFYGWVWFSFIAITFLFLAIFVRSRTIVKVPTTAKRLRMALVNLAGYPIAILVSWIPSTFVDFYIYNRPDVTIPEWILHMNYSLDCSMGLMCAIVFFSGKGIRVRWATFYRVKFSIAKYNDLVRFGITENEIVIKPIAEWSANSDLKGDQKLQARPMLGEIAPKRKPGSEFEMC